MKLTLCVSEAVTVSCQGGNKIAKEERESSLCQRNGSRFHFNCFPLNGWRL